MRKLSGTRISESAGNRNISVENFWMNIVHSRKRNQYTCHRVLKVFTSYGELWICDVWKSYLLTPKVNRTTTGHKANMNFIPFRTLTDVSKKRGVAMEVIIKFPVGRHLFGILRFVVLSGCSLLWCILSAQLQEQFTNHFDSKTLEVVVDRYEQSVSSGWQEKKCFPFWKS